MLLNRRRAMWDLPRPDNDTINEWVRVLDGVDPIQAFAALDRLIAETRPPSPARIIAEVRTRVPAVHHIRPVGDPNCDVCEGTGFTLIHDPDEPDGRRYGPCAVCRPEHPYNSRHRAHRAPSAPGAVATAEGRSLIQTIRDSIHRHPSSHRPDGAA